ncbi:MAG: hypothetical protein IJA48_09120 [Oscillospiraceae bacterium]|nr:hypothetical protein [Oscillospiraceae bacterium]
MAAVRKILGKLRGKGNNPATYKVFLNATNPLDMDAAANLTAWHKLFNDNGLDASALSIAKMNEDAFRAFEQELTAEEVSKNEAYEIVHNALTSMGYDSITHIGGGGFNKNDGTRHRVFIVFEPEQIKSAEPVTYDNDGNVIPLSERFNEKKSDIRLSKKSKSDSYSDDTSGAHWAIKDHLIDRKDLAVFYDAIAKLSKLGYYYPRTFDGEYIVENGNVMMFTDGNYEQPTISRVISFNDKSETNMAEYKEWIYNGVRQRGTAGLREAIDLIEAIEGDGYVSQRSPSDRGSYGWKNRAGEGSDRRAALDGADTAGKTVRESKKSTDSNTAYSERYGSEMQTEGQVERAQARAEQRAAEVKQMNEAAAVVEETKAIVSEALETAEKPKTSERANPLLKPKDTDRANFVEIRSLGNG